MAVRQSATDLVLFCLIASFQVVFVVQQDVWKVLFVDVANKFWRNVVTQPSCTKNTVKVRICYVSEAVLWSELNVNCVQNVQQEVIQKKMF